ncbi:hypothetical protein FH972_024501 [Carpinus fangiana]|uniref:DUF4112 domain-containing protein n=1 Tax=Carpinus fangiana TaxID=176857 RepID=A0A5N6KZ39_9ROSI|nr:hypothetical protein FH972_024501 [Carpinus fangiana]
MASYVSKYAAKKLLGKQMDKYRTKKVAGADVSSPPLPPCICCDSMLTVPQDPYFVEVPGRHGKMKKVKKQIPDFIPEHDAKCLASAKNLAYRMDMSLFSFGGVRFGWGSVIGIIPELGDVIDLIFATMVYKRCKAIEGGLPSNLQTKMLMNIIIDFIIGLIPFIGDIADAAYRCNTKNVLLLEDHLRKKYGPEDKKARQTAGYELFEDDPDFTHQQTAGVIEQPPRDVQTKETKKGGLGLSSGDKRTREPDLEMGHPVAAGTEVCIGVNLRTVLGCVSGVLLASPGSEAHMVVLQGQHARVADDCLAVTGGGGQFPRRADDVGHNTWEVLLDGSKVLGQQAVDGAVLRRDWGLLLPFIDEQVGQGRRQDARKGGQLLLQQIPHRKGINDTKGCFAVVDEPGQGEASSLGGFSKNLLGQAGGGVAPADDFTAFLFGRLDDKLVPLDGLKVGLACRRRRLGGQVGEWSIQSPGYILVGRKACLNLCEQSTCSYMVVLIAGKNVKHMEGIASAASAASAGNLTLGLLVQDVQQRQRGDAQRQRQQKMAL